MGRVVLLVVAMVGAVVGCHASGSAGDEDAGHDAGPIGPPSYEGEIDGVDIILVPERVGAMDLEILLHSSGVYTLMNSLVVPTSDWPYPAIENVRFAVVSHDLGLQYGADRSVEGFPYSTKVPTCTDQDAKGDNGSFHTSMGGTTDIDSGTIRCDDDALQCPDYWSCEGGMCVSPSGGAEAVNCKDLTSGDDWAETTRDEQNPDLAVQAACLSKHRSSGCGIEQQLEAPVLALEKETQQDFLVDSHLLAVIIITDEEDCSIMDRGLFETPEWRSKTLVKEDDPQSGLLNTACNLPASNEEQFLFPESRYREELVKRKGGYSDMVVFASIVGVPYEKGTPCIGPGDELGGCLEHDDMELKVQIFEQAGTPYKHLAPACVRKVGDVEVSSAKPGRRFVEVAQSFGELGYVSSICEADWNPAFRDIAEIIAERVERSKE